MSDPRIYTNWHRRDLLYFWELSEAHRAEARETYDYTDPEELQYIVYRGVLYSLDDFMNAHNTFYCPNLPAWMRSWDGYLTDSFFSGVLLKHDDDDCERVIMATFIS